jgi:hypothetical protein
MMDADVVDPIDAGTDANIDPKWGCLGNVKWLPQSTTETVMVRNKYVRLIGSAPIVGVRVKACVAFDPECTSPVAEAESDAQGEVLVKVPRNFRGYIHIPIAPPSFPQMAPHLIAQSPPPDTDQLDVSRPDLISPLLSISELDLILLQTGSKADPNLGHLFGNARDCEVKLTSGVSLRTSVRDQKTIQFYFIDSDSASVTAQETGPPGTAGFLNLPIGSITLEGTVPSIARKHSNLSYLIKKGTITLTDFAVTPL